VKKMTQKVAIEPALDPIKDYLSQRGYQVESVNFGEIPASQAGKFDAIIVTGMNSNFLGMGDTSTKAVVIEATGMSPEQVYHELQLRLE
jgi:galactitol-specific phosphotransferase system IIB component